jgi:hypothetical protein
MAKSRLSKRRTNNQEKRAQEKYRQSLTAPEESDLSSSGKMPTKRGNNATTAWDTLEEEEDEEEEETRKSFSMEDLFDFLGQTQIALIISLMFGGVVAAAHSVGWEHFLGWAFFFLILGFPLVRREKPGSPAWKILAMGILFPFFGASIVLLPFVLLILGLTAIAGNDGLKALRVFLGVFCIPILGILSILYKVPLPMVFGITLANMGFVAGLSLLFGENGPSGTRLGSLPWRVLGTWESTDREKSKNRGPASLFAIPEKKSIRMPVQTGFQHFFLGLSGIAGLVLFVSLLLWLIQIPFIPLWITLDALWVMSCALIALYFSSGAYLIDSRQKKLTSYVTNPLYVKSRDLSSEEIYGVVLGRKRITQGIILRKPTIGYSLTLILHDGTVIPMPLPDFSIFSDEEVFFHLKKCGSRIGNVLQTSFFVVTGDFYQHDWEHLKSDHLFRKKDPRALKALWDVVNESRCLEVPPGKTTDLLKTEITTAWEWGILVAVSFFFLWVTLGMVKKEWDWLTANPRIIYLILLDFSTLMMTLLAIWKLLVDEYFLFDLKSRTIRFFSRIFIFQADEVKLPFSAVDHIVLEKYDEVFWVLGKRFRLKVVPKAEWGSPLVITDFSGLQEEMLERGKALAEIMQVPFLAGETIGPGMDRIECREQEKFQ